MSVSTVNDLSSQVEEAGQFDTIAMSVQVTVPGQFSTTPSVQVITIAIGVSIPVVIVFITITTTIILFAIR